MSNTNQNVRTFYKPKPNAGGGIVGGTHAKTVHKAGAAVTTYYKGVSESTKVDTPDIGRARMRLKLASIAFHRANACARPDDPQAPALIRSALGMIHKAALGYVSTLLGKPMAPVGLDPSKSHDLQLAAMAYEASRHGQDANPAFSTAGIAFLCQMSIYYAEAIGALAEPVSEHMLQLDEGGT